MRASIANRVMNADIVPPGPPTPTVTLGRPKARFFVFLSFVWCVISLLAVGWWLSGFGEVILTGPEDADPPAWWSRRPEENPIFWMLLAPHPLLVLLAIYFRFTERPRRMVVHSREPGGPIIH